MDSGSARRANFLITTFYYFVLRVNIIQIDLLVSVILVVYWRGKAQSASKRGLRGLLEPISSCGSYLESYSYGRGLIFFQDCRGDLGGELP